MVDEPSEQKKNKEDKEAIYHSYFQQTFFEQLVAYYQQKILYSKQDEGTQQTVNTVLK